MRRISLHMYMTIDGYAYFPDYPGAKGFEDDNINYEMWEKHWPNIDTTIFGRKSYEEGAAFWPSSNRKKSEHPFYHAFSKFLDQTNKIVITTTLKNPTWEHSKIMSGPINNIVRELRNEPGKNIAICGGVTIAQEFMNLGLIDDYYLTVYPVILGTSTKDALMLFNKIQKQQTLSLRSVKPMKYGEYVLHYEAVR